MPPPAQLGLAMDSLQAPPLPWPGTLYSPPPPLQAPPLLLGRLVPRSILQTSSFDLKTQLQRMLSSSDSPPLWPAARQKRQDPCQPGDDLASLFPQSYIWTPQKSPTISTFMRRTPGSRHTSPPSSRRPLPRCRPSCPLRPVRAAPSVWSRSPPPLSPTTSCEPGSAPPDLRHPRMEEKPRGPVL